jgi:hypothetical protein
MDLFSELDQAPQDALIHARAPSRAQRDAVARKQREDRQRMEEANLPRNVDCGPCEPPCPTVLAGVDDPSLCRMCLAAVGRARAV